MSTKIKALACAFLALTMSACGGGSSPQYLISGAVTGLATQGLMLAQGAEVIAISAGQTAFAFPGKISSGEAYAVTIRSQPRERDQVCALNNESGVVASGDVANITVSCHATEWVVTTMAGSGTAGDAEGNGVAASFSSPWGVAVDQNGRLYVADRGNNKIRSISPDGVVSTFAGSGVLGFANGPAAAAAFNVPHGVDVDAAGTVYVADSTNCAIRKITSSGVVSTLAGNPSSCYNIVNIDGIGSQASFSQPVDVSVASNGVIYVADAGHHAIRHITSSGAVTTVAAASVADPYPYGVSADDSAGNVYYLDNNHSLLYKLSLDGTVSLLAGSAGGGTPRDGVGTSASFLSPWSLAVDAQGNIYVGDSGGIIRKVTPDGRVTTIAGTPFSGSGVEDGIGPAASFSLPTGIAVGRDGTLYVSDAVSNKIRRIVAR